MSRTIVEENQINSKRDVNKEALDAIKEWIVANGSCFDGYTSDSNRFHAYGFYCEDNDEMCVYPTELRAFLTKGNFSEGKTLRYLKENEDCYRSEIEFWLKDMYGKLPANDYQKLRDYYVLGGIYRA